MTQEARNFTTDIAIIGSGLAGMAAGIFALKRGLATAQTGNTGAIAYTTGYLDLLGSIGGHSPGMLTDPWAGIQQLHATQPDHPLASIHQDDIRTSFEQFTAFITECGIAYGAPGDTNLLALTPAGTSKPTLCVPATMQAGVDAYSAKLPCMIVDFKGLRGFSARQVMANLHRQWPGLRAERIEFPDIPGGEIYPEVMARALEVPGNREKLADRIKGLIADAEVVGMPAIMGMHNPDEVMADLARRLACPVFEIPTMPPSVPGIRLREMFEQVFPQKGLTLVPQQKVRSIDFTDTELTLQLGDSFGPITIHAKTAILATGRFLSGGLEADIDGITEPLLQLPVTQPATRDEWYKLDYMDPDGHEVHRCGIEVDEHFRPLNVSGEAVDHRLFAAGVILAHQDWIRGRCGAGVAIATAYKAVEAACRVIESAKDGVVTPNTTPTKR